MLYRETPRLENKMIENNMTDSDQECIKLVLSGNREQSRHLIERHKNTIFRVIFLRVQCERTAEDLTQEVFIKAFKNLGNFRSEAKFSTWLTQIALNQCRTFRRSNPSSREPLELEQHHLEQACSGLDAENGLHFKRLVQAFRSCLDKIPEKFQSVLIICGIEQQEYSDAALALEIPIGTVRSRLNKARELIKDCMNLREVEEV